jgi:hypothetical protein
MCLSQYTINNTEVVTQMDNPEKLTTKVAQDKE